MLARLAILAASLLIIVGLTQPGFARGKNSRKTETVTGCLMQGDHANEYAIKAQDGKTYGLLSSSVNLAEHMGHKVEVTGAVTHAKEKTGSEAKTGLPEENAHMNVTSVKMISTTCQ